MKEIKCEVIQELLPLYEDNAASDESQELVRAHLKDCPACREELRKMRTPISLPPDEDEEAVKRFLKYRAEVRRKQNVKIACVATVLAAIILLCLWYVWPKNWAAVIGTDQVDALSGFNFDWIGKISYIGNDPQLGEIHEYNSWNLEEVESGEPAAKAILSALDRYSYRADLINLRSYTPFPRNGFHVTGASSLILYLRTQERLIMVTIYSNGQLTVHGASDLATGFLSYKTDGRLFEEIFRALQTYGTLDQEQEVIKR